MSFEINCAQNLCFFSNAVAKKGFKDSGVHVARNS
jgi:hypothetical protein